MTNEHERGVEAATDILLLRAHELSARELAERAIAAYIEAVGFDSAPVLLSRIEELERYEDRLCIDPGGSDKIDELESAMELLRFRATAAESKLAEAVKVKALEWKEGNSAKSLGLEYLVSSYSDPLDDGKGNWISLLFSGNYSGRHHSIEEAKASCQADYESRIRSALIGGADGK